MFVHLAVVWCALVAQAFSQYSSSAAFLKPGSRIPYQVAAFTRLDTESTTRFEGNPFFEIYDLVKRFHYLNMPLVRYVADGEALRENLRELNRALRKKRFEGLQDYADLEDPYTKRTSLKRLAILSARGFGRK